MKMTNATATTADVATCMRYANKQNSLIKLDILIDRCLSHEKVVASVQTQTWTSLACSCLFCHSSLPDVQIWQDEIIDGYVIAPCGSCLQQVRILFDN